MSVSVKFGKIEMSHVKDKKGQYLQFKKGEGVLKIPRGDCLQEFYELMSTACELATVRGSLRVITLKTMNDLGPDAKGFIFTVEKTHKSIHITPVNMLLNKDPLRITVEEWEEIADKFITVKDILDDLDD